MVTRKHMKHDFRKSEDRVLDSFRQSLQAAKTRLLRVRADREAQEVTRFGGWTRRVQVISQADVTVAAEFDVPLAALPEGTWLEIGSPQHAPLLALVSAARPGDHIDVLAACLEDSDDLMSHLVMPELEFHPVRQGLGWTELQRRWSYRGRLTASRTALRCHLLIDLKAS